MLGADPNEAAAAPASFDTGFDTTPVTVTVIPAPAPKSAPVETGFGEMDGTAMPVQQAAPTEKTVAATGKPEDPDPDLDARVAGLLANKSVTDWNAVSAFMANVVAWPASPQDAGFVNLHYSMVNPGPDAKTKPLLKGMGWPFKSVDEFVGRASWLNTMNNFKDAWFCTSLQKAMKQNTKGKPKAVRFAANALAQKSIWVDIDVGPDDPKKYATVEEALAAILLFQKTVGLPPPSAIVFSGGGIHVYWISKTALTPEQWGPYASGLRNLLLANAVKCDSGLTTDIARILRVPGTFNHKYDPPKPVQLSPLPLVMYDFSPKLDFLIPLAGAVPSPGAVKATTILFADGVDPASFGKPHPLFAGLTDTLGAGIEHESVLLKAEPIFKQCGFFEEALMTGGANFGNALWMYSVLGSTFMENGNVIAHEISKRHISYSPVDTQALYDRKVAERADRGIGYPSCATIAGAGCKSCATCPLFNKGKSPLNLGLPSSPGLGPSQNLTPVTRFRDLDRLGQPKPTLANAVIAIRELNIKPRLDLFHNRTIVSYSGTSKTLRDGLLTDHTVSAVRSLINNTFLIDCGDPNTLAALNETARENAFDPVLDLLTDCQGKWDGVKRLDTWVIDYLGCEDTPLNRAIGRSVLVAGCHRARVPGCKFDFITVLEGPEGIDKSTAIRVLAGDDNFSDQSILGASDKEVQEQLEGTWMHENADLAGMRRADVEQVKAFASRQVDRARPAYGRVREDRPRRSIEWATTNDDTYLQSQTGNRRWWPLKTGKVNIDALKRDREQLLGEAATYEEAGESIGLHPSLWSDAREAQEQRRVADPWEDLLIYMPENIIHRSGDGNERVASADVLTVVLQIPRAQQTSAHGQRLAKAMEHAGDWKRNKSGNVTIGGVPVRGYVRPSFRQTIAEAGTRGPFDAAKRRCEAAMGVDEPKGPAVQTGVCQAAMEAANPPGLTD
jgi:predicted P-loop ATPase